jgi:competence protein ComEC
MLHPGWSSYAIADLKDNDRSCVLKIETAGGSLLLAGDIEYPSEAALLERDRSVLDTDVLVVPHHGSKTSSTPEFIDAVSPQAAVFTVGYRNRFGHPKPEVVQRYRERGSMLYRSDGDGAVLFEFLPRGIEVQSWRRSAPRYWHERGFGLAENGRAG